MNFQVLDQGNVVEFDHPYQLLQHHRGHFHQMVLQTGPQTEQRLHSLAKVAFLARTPQVYFPHVENGTVIREEPESGWNRGSGEARSVNGDSDKSKEERSSVNSSPEQSSNEYEISKEERMNSIDVSLDSETTNPESISTESSASSQSEAKEKERSSYARGSYDLDLVYQEPQPADSDSQYGDIISNTESCDSIETSRL